MQAVFFTLQIETRIALGAVRFHCEMEQVGLVGAIRIDESQDIFQVAFVERSGLLAHRLENLELIL